MEKISFRHPRVEKKYVTQMRITKEEVALYTFEKIDREIKELCALAPTDMNAPYVFNFCFPVLRAYFRPLGFDDAEILNRREEMKQNLAKVTKDECIPALLKLMLPAIKEDRQQALLFGKMFLLERALRQKAAGREGKKYQEVAIEIEEALLDGVTGAVEARYRKFIAIVEPTIIATLKDFPELMKSQPCIEIVPSPKKVRKSSSRGSSGNDRSP